MPRSIRCMLMFQGDAEEALQLYISLFAGSRIDSLLHWGPGEPGREGAFKQAEVTLAGYKLLIFDSPAKHEFGFTPAISIFVDCADEAEWSSAYEKLSEGGMTLMPPGDYGFSKKFTWLNDRFGVSWQLNLPS